MPESWLKWLQLRSNDDLEALSGLLDVNIKDMTYSDLRKPLASAIVAFSYITNMGAVTVPRDPATQAEIWTSYYGAEEVSKYVAAANLLDQGM